MLVLPVLLLLFLLFLLFLRLDSISLLHLSQAKRIGHEGLICGLLLLFDGEKRVFANLGRNVTSGICVLRRNKILMRSSNLRLVSLG